MLLREQKREWIWERKSLSENVGHCVPVASFPGSPHMRMKNKMERESLVKIYHVRNIIGRENLITCGQTNELAHAILTEYTRSIVKAFIWLTEWG